MKKVLIASGVVLALGVGLYFAARFSQAKFEGVDTTVVEKAAHDAGRAPSVPFIDIDGKGDLPLFLFLLAGAVGGFVAGYSFRGLFGPKDSESSHDAANA